MTIKNKQNNNKNNNIYNNNLTKELFFKCWNNIIIKKVILSHIDINDVKLYNIYKNQLIPFDHNKEYKHKNHFSLIKVTLNNEKSTEECFKKLPWFTREIKFENHFKPGQDDIFKNVPCFNSLESIIFDSLFNCEIDFKWLLSLKRLEFGTFYNKKFITPLPKSLEYLELGTYYNQPFEKGILPSRLSTLIIKGNFNQPVYSGNLPNELEILHLPDNYSLSISSLPNTLISFKPVNPKFNKSLYGKLQELKHIEFSKFISVSSDIVTDGPFSKCTNIETIKFNCIFRNQDIQINSLPISVKSITFKRELINSNLSIDSIPNYNIEKIKFKRSNKYLDSDDQIFIIPSSVKSLSLLNIPSKGIIELGQSLTSLEFKKQLPHDDPIIPIPNGLLPSTLQSLDFTQYNFKNGFILKLSSFNSEPLKLKSLKLGSMNGNCIGLYLPKCLQSFDVAVLKNDEMILPIISNLSNLSTIKITSFFYQPVTIGMFPLSLTHLDLSQNQSNFSNNVENGSLPNLEHIIFPKTYNGTPMFLNYSPNLKSIEFGRDFSIYLVSRYSHKPNYLQLQSLTSITLCDGFQQEITDDLFPKSLQHLTIKLEESRYFPSYYGISSLPHQLITFTFINFTPKYITTTCFPKSFKKLIVNNNNYTFLTEENIKKYSKYLIVI